MLRARAEAALPPVQGQLRIAGLREPVEIVRDRWGVPHIYARNLHDAYFTQGFVVASERLFQLDFTARLATGRLSELLGDLTLSIDRFVRTVGWNRAGRRYTERWDDLSWEISEAYAEGVFAWVDTMPVRPIEYEILQQDPVFERGREGVEMAAANAVFFAWTQSTNWDAELLRAEIAEQLGWEEMLALFPDLPADAPPVVPGKDEGIGGRLAALELLRQAPVLPGRQGSNSWVVSGERTTTGMPLLANDPHVFVQVPSMFYELQLSAPGLEAGGVALHFSPGVLIGHNERIAWGYTTLPGDSQDLFMERLNEDRTAALYNGVWEELTVHREEIRVRGRSEPEIVEVRETRHGPILESYMVGMANPEVVEEGLRETYAMRWVGMEDITIPSTVHRVSTAASFDEFRAALADWTCSGVHAVYADVDGNIGYQAAGLYPVRKKGDGTVPVPGWTDDYEWNGYIPYEALPWALNPKEGFIATANNRPHGESYPYLIGRDFLPPYRARRIAQCITERAVHDVQSFARMQMDTVSIPARTMIPYLVSIEPAGDRQKQALAILGDWDFDLRADSAAAAIFEVWCCRIADEVLLPHLGAELYRHFHSHRQWGTIAFQYEVLPAILEFPTARWFGEDGHAGRDKVLLRALDRALDELTAALGDDMTEWQWGVLHTVQFAGRFSILPDLGELFVAGEGPLGGDEQTIAQGQYEPGTPYRALVVPAWRQIIDLSDLDASVGVQPPGQSGNPASPHFNDQFDLWMNGRHHALPFSRSAVDAQAESTLNLLPPE
ncbi:MAG TPA: penicillin acylase family protein [Actinomycetota bacterium]|nr:penicillin acylase family protein [Actinomycetota bacterium]